MELVLAFVALVGAVCQYLYWSVRVQIEGLPRETVLAGATVAGTSVLCLAMLATHSVAVAAVAPLGTRLDSLARGRWFFVARIAILTTALCYALWVLGMGAPYMFGQGGTAPQVVQQLADHEARLKQHDKILDQIAGQQIGERLAVLEKATLEMREELTWTSRFALSTLLAMVAFLIKEILAVARERLPKR